MADKKQVEAVEVMDTVFSQINDILKDVDISDISADSADYYELPEGYFLVELTEAKLGLSQKGQSMVTLKFKVVEDGVVDDVDTRGNVVFKPVKNTKDKTTTLYYVLKDEPSLRRFIKDMLKFEGEVEGEPILSKDYFLNAELLPDALDILVGLRLWLQVSVTEKDGNKSTWKNLISWTRANKLELPE